MSPRTSSMPVLASLDSSRSPCPGSFLSPVMTQSLDQHTEKDSLLSMTTMRTSVGDTLRRWLAAVRPAMPPPKTRTVFVLIVASLAEGEDAVRLFCEAHQVIHGGHGTHGAGVHLPDAQAGAAAQGGAS